MKGPLKWHGGKSYLAPKLVELMPAHTRYCEPFFGGGAVLFAKPCEGVSEFVNDLHSELTMFWAVLRDRELFAEFQRTVEATPFAEDSFCTADIENQVPRPLANWAIVERAVAFFVRNRQSRQGLGRDFATPTKRIRRGMNENVSAWLSAVECLPEVHARLKRVEIHNRDALEFIDRLDSPETFFYCDPPYLHETRTSTGEYAHELTAGDHKDLLNCLRKIKGKFLLSGYPSRLYDHHSAEHGWRVVDFTIDNKASAKKSKEMKIERVWMNY